MDKSCKQVSPRANMNPDLHEPDPLDGFALLLVDDHPLFRDGLATALQHQARQLQIVTTASLDQALEAVAARSGGFDLILMDYRLPGQDGLQAARLLMERYPAVAVGLMSGMEDPSLPLLARQAGLLAYLPKTLEIDALVEHLRRLARGEPVFVAPQGSVDATRQLSSGAGLTARQIDILRLLAKGSSNKEIARLIGISPATVKNHVEAIFTRLEASNRMQAVMKAQAMLGELDRLG